MLPITPSPLAGSMAVITAARPAIRILGASGAGIIRHRQQLRGFRWACFSEPNIQREMRRRHKMIRHKYTATLDRRLSWEKHPFADDAKLALKRMMKGAWQPDQAWRGRAWFDDVDQQIKPAEAATAAEFEDPVYRKEDFETDPKTLWSKTFDGAKSRGIKRKNEAAPTEADYVIDPISNRRVPKHPAPSVFSELFNQASDRKPFATQTIQRTEPIFYDGPPPVEELREYAKVDAEARNNNIEEVYETPSAKSPTLESDEYVQNHSLDAAVSQKAKKGEVSWSYDSVSWRQEGGSKPVVKHYSDSGKFDLPTRASSAKQPTIKFDQASQPRQPSTEPLFENEDLSKYKPVRHQEPHGQPAPSAEEQSKEYDDLDKYKSVKYQEPHGRPEPTAEEKSKDYEDLHKYGGYKPTNGGAESTESLVQSSPSAQPYDDLDQYKSVMHNEPDGKPADVAANDRDCLKEVDAKSHYNVAARVAPSDVDTSDLSSAELLAKMRQSRHQSPIIPQAQDTATKRRKSLDAAMLRHQVASDTLDQRASEAVRAARVGAKMDKRLTGNYARDFPEEFGKSWSQEIYHVEGKPSTASNSRLQTSLDRGRTASKAAELDPYSKKPQGLETSYARECGGKQTQPTLMKSYGSVETDQPQTGQATSEAEAANPSTLYKVLAYDPIMQKVNVAETSSGIPDVATPLTPAEAIVRLSNPSKFFPHFAPLQAQGFEIVSSSGDVLVFRKVQKPVAAATATAASSRESSTAATVNPIDMMGKPQHFTPASANFASPTGYVAYDFIDAEHVKDLPPPPSSSTNSHNNGDSGRVKSNIDVRREEPVFSGTRGEPWDRAEEGRRKRGLGKRLVVGAAWVAGISYALGVVGEYFSTGGVDGSGPKGF